MADKIPAGQTPELVNSPMDCPTIVVDGTAGLAMGEHMTKIHFVEHTAAKDQKVLARYVVNLAMPNDQFLKVAASFTKAVEQLKVVAGDGADQVED
ncbi:MAG: hypothetical protein P8J20_11165 [Novosphingobium sp.]|nr:hypothetical protein [Novosphingobium sp.]